MAAARAATRASVSPVTSAWTHVVLFVTIRSDPLPSCLCFELLAVADSLAIRVATVPISIPFSVQSKISKRFQVL